MVVDAPSSALLPNWDTIAKVTHTPWQLFSTKKMHAFVGMSVLPRDLRTKQIALACSRFSLDMSG